MEVNLHNGQEIANQLPKELDRRVCERARRARDARFDGRFFTAVKSTLIYCRPVCPANPPLEKNVDYYPTAVSAAQAGYRPCLRCRPDSAPHSNAWLGSQITFKRALDLVNQGALRENSVVELASRLGISSRYLNILFQRNLGISVKRYAIYQQCLFAKQLLHQSSLPITQIAFAAGFKSVRRFNEAMRQQLRLVPRDIRKNETSVQDGLQLKLYYRPPFAWSQCHEFLRSRMIEGLEWATDSSYSRTIRYKDTTGYISVKNLAEQNCLLLNLQLDNYQNLNAVTHQVRSMFDVDAPIDLIDEQIQIVLGESFSYLHGLRIPGIWNSFEAGMRAILGQQVSVAQAQNLVTLLLEHLGEEINIDGKPSGKLFPEPEQVYEHPLDFFKMPQARKDTVRRLAKHFLEADDPSDIESWIDIKGIGPWTVNYVKIRADKNPDVWLAGDAGINNALRKLDFELDPTAAKPWRSYLTFQLWNSLSQKNM